MVKVFVDTSALFALVDAADLEHAKVKSAWTGSLQQNTFLVTSNYVLVETSALVQRRHGMNTAVEFFNSHVPLLSVVWIDELTHDHALSAWIDANRNKLSLVDCISFQVMRDQQISRAFTLDRHFREQGFDTIP